MKLIHKGTTNSGLPLTVFETDSPNVKAKESDKFKVYCIGEPDYNGLSKVEKRILLLPLVEVIRDFYKDPKTCQEFEEWKAERGKEKK